MGKDELRLLDTLVDVFTRKQALDQEWAETNRRASMLLHRTGPLYYCGHFMEVRNSALEVRAVRSIPQEVEQ